MICGVILILAVFFPNVAAENDSMKVLVTIDREEDYFGGDTGKVTVHVFDKGEYIEPDEIPDCKIKGGYYPDTVERNITLEKKSAGIYEGDFKIYSSDADELNRMVISADASYGKSDEDDTEYNLDEDSQSIDISSKEDEDEEVSVSIIDAPPSLFPGDTITLRIEVKKGDVLTDADELDINYELEYEEGDPDENELPYDKVSNGIYEAVLIVPKGIKESCQIDITAEATIDEDFDFDFESVKIDFFSVWYKKGSLGETVCTFDVYVSDAEGKALTNADINLNWDEWRRSSENEATKLTDGSGKASFEITYEEDTDDLEITGKIMKDGKTQFFSGVIELKEDGEEEGEWAEPDYYGMDVVFRNKQLSGESPYTLECRAFLEGQRISKKEVYYYIYDDLNVIAHGAATTDIDGEFSIKFSYSPKGLFDTIRTYFETADGDYDGWSWDERKNSLDGKEYASETDYVRFEIDEVPDVDFDDTSIKITVNELKRGGLTEVTVTGIPADMLAHVSWIPSSVDNIKDIDEWEKTFEWNQWAGEGLMAQGTSVSNGKLTCELMIPEFMPSGKYTIFAGYIDESDIDDPNFSLEEAYHINNVILEPGESGTSTGTSVGSLFSSGGFVWLSVGIFIIILVAIIVIILMVRRKKGKTVSGSPEKDDQDHYLDSDTMVQTQSDLSYPPPYESQTEAPNTFYPRPPNDNPHPLEQQSHMPQQGQFPPPPRRGGYPPPPY